MTDHTCYSNTLRSEMEKLKQANSALLAEAVEREKELSLLREAVGHCYGIVTEPSAVSEEERVQKVTWPGCTLGYPQPEELQAETTSEQQCSCQCGYENSSPPNCS